MVGNVGWGGRIILSNRAIKGRGSKTRSLQLLVILLSHFSEKSSIRGCIIFAEKQYCSLSDPSNCERDGSVKIKDSKHILFSLPTNPTNVQEYLDRRHNHAKYPCPQAPLFKTISMTKVIFVLHITNR